MHLAHQSLFSNLDDNGAIVVIETGYANLTPKANREEYSSYPIFYYPLNEIKHLDGIEFINLLLEEYPKLEKIVVGYDFHFGKNRKYSTSHLKEFFKKDVVVIDEVNFNNLSVHSKNIRNHLNNGDIEIANQLLDKPYKIKGNIIKGQGLGKKQFVPTLNLNCDDFLVPNEGIYATKTIVNNIEFNSVTFIGHRVTTDGKYAIETHIIDQNLKDASTNVQIKFFKKIRENKKFDEYEQLKQQILKDIDDVKLFYTLFI